ncbi:Putative amidase AmiC [Alcanivorax sp. ALC70]|nr:Putative amidase AmiC [Alcanivorax sp. ALC70]
MKSEASQALPVDLIGEGVLTRSVRDTARFFAAAEGYYRNPKLPAIGEVTGPGKRRLKVGLVVDSITGRATDADTRAAVEDAARLLADLGHHVEEAPIPLKPSFIDDFVTYYGMMAFMVRTFGHRLFGPGFERARLDDLTQGLAGHYRKRMLKTPAVLYRLRRSWREYARAFENYDVVLSPVLAHTTPKLGYLSPTQPFETLIERLIHYASFTPANNASGSPAISLPLGPRRKGCPSACNWRRCRAASAPCWNWPTRWRRPGPGGAFRTLDRPLETLLSVFIFTLPSRTRVPGRLQHRCQSDSDPKSQEVI